MRKFLMLAVLLFLTNASLIFAEQKKFGYFTIEYSGLSDPLTESERKFSPVEYHFRLSRKNKKVKEISATFQVSRKVVDLKIQSLLYRYDRTSGFIPEVLKPPISFCYDEEPIYPILKKCLAWSIGKAGCSLQEGNYTLLAYSLEEETKAFIGNQTFYGNFKTRIIFMEGDEDHKIAGVDINYEIKEAKDCNGAKSNKIKSNDPNP